MSWWPFKKKARFQKQEFVSDFVKNASKPIPGQRAISQLEFVVLDTETSGLNSQKDQILSFGAVKIIRKSIVISSAVEWYPEIEVKGERAATIHGLVKTSNQLEHSIFMKKITDYLGGAILVGHHVGFDLEMLLQLGRRFGLDTFPNSVIDTQNFALRLEQGPQADFGQFRPEEYSLDRVCERYNIPLEDRHTASGDAFLTAQLFLKLLQLAQKKGINTYQELIR